jgi:hypothetical protein
MSGYKPKVQLLGASVSLSTSYFIETCYEESKAKVTLQSMIQFRGGN